MRCYRIRDLLARLRELGAEPRRCRGSHMVVSFPSGRSCVIKVNHVGDDASPIVLANVRRLVRSEGFVL